MAKARKKPSFNVTTFLTTVDGGRTAATYKTKERVYSQGDQADAVFYIQAGKIKVCVISDWGKEAVVALHAKGDFFGEGCLVGCSTGISAGFAPRRILSTKSAARR